MLIGVLECQCSATNCPVLTVSTTQQYPLLLNHSCAVDEMGSRLDELEKSISDLVQQAGVDAGVTPAGSSPEKV